MVTLWWSAVGGWRVMPGDFWGELKKIWSLLVGDVILFENGSVRVR